MFVYSKRLVQFIKEIKEGIKEILSKEIQLKVQGERFFDRNHRYSYPISVVIYNHKPELGYFDPEFYELGFHEKTIYMHTAQLYHLLRHELAHYITFIQEGCEKTPHGEKFRAFCLRMGWGEEVSKASMSIEIPEKENSAIFRKIQKLLALSTSSNPYEAEAAILKSQQILLTHHLEASLAIDKEKEETIFLKRVLKQKRMSPKLHAIAKILETFFVNVIFSRSSQYTYLEITGTEASVEVAEHVGEILDRKLEELWSHTQKEHKQLKGLVAKHSFFLGIAKGYLNKIQSLQKEEAVIKERSLLVIERTLQKAREMVYPHLSKVSRARGYCSTSSALGEREGKRLRIDPAVTTSSTKGKELLSYFKT